MEKWKHRFAVLFTVKFFGLGSFDVRTCLSLSLCSNDAKTAPHGGHTICDQRTRNEQTKKKKENNQPNQRKQQCAEIAASRWLFGLRRSEDKGKAMSCGMIALNRRQPMDARIRKLTKNEIWQIVWEKQWMATSASIEASQHMTWCSASPTSRWEMNAQQSIQIMEPCNTTKYNQLMCDVCSWVIVPLSCRNFRNIKTYIVET